jgi:predicted tellurium resistance membrane protein TerC
VRNDFEFGFLKAHGWGIVGAVIVALALIASSLIALYEFSPWKILAMGLAFLLANVRKLFSTKLSSPAEQAERSEGKGTQVETQARSGRTGRAKSRKQKQVLTPGSPSLARATESVQTLKQPAARARRG